MADKLFTPQTTVSLEMPNQNQDLVDLMDNLIKMKIQQQDWEYKDTMRKLEAKDRENLMKRNQYMLGKISQEWGEDRVNELVQQGFEDPVSLEQMLQVEFTNSYLRQAKDDPKLLEPEELTKNQNKLHPDVYNNLLKVSMQEKENQVVDELSKKLFEKKLSYPQWREELSKAGINPDKYEYVFNQYQQERNYQRTLAGSAGAGAGAGKVKEEKEVIQPIETNYLAEAFKYADVKIPAGFFDSKQFNKANIEEAESAVNSQITAIQNIVSKLPAQAQTQVDKKVARPAYEPYNKPYGLRYLIRNVDTKKNEIQLVDIYTAKMYLINNKGDVWIKMKSDGEEYWKKVNEKKDENAPILKTLSKNYYNKLLEYHNARNMLTNVAKEQYNILKKLSETEKTTEKIKSYYDK